MTDIANRKGFDEVLKNAMHLSNRFHTPLSLVVVNLDAFQAYNRTHGEQAGDDCLKQMATFLLGQAKRSVDFVARTEGDEFSIILPGCDQHQAEMLINKVQMALQADHGQALGLASPLSLSYGLAVHHDDTPESLYRKAVQALAQAKDKGRNRYEVFNQII